MVIEVASIKAWRYCWEAQQTDLQTKRDGETTSYRSEHISLFSSVTTALVNYLPPPKEQGGVHWSWLSEGSSLARNSLT